MGMPNAYRCEICSNKFFEGTTAGKEALRAHYESGHSGFSAPAEKNAYKCHHENCDKFKATICEIVEHDRADHTGR